VTVAILKAYGWPLLASILAAWALTECSARRQAEAALEVEQTLSESRATLERGLAKARGVAEAQRAGIDAARAVVEAVTRVEETEAAREVGQAEADEAAIADEYRRTGRVVEAARRSWERWRASAPEASGASQVRP